VLVQNDLVMAPELKLEALKVRTDTLDIVRLGNDREEQHEHRKLRVNLGEIVIAAFVHKDEVITKAGKRAIHHAAF
jgi:hypothetical protein